jgi:hypothetical protein
MGGHGDDKTRIAGIVQRFKTGALLYAEGIEDEDNSVQDEGVAGVKNALRELDELGPHGRDALIPLLDDSAPGIRVYAAGSLVKIVPDRAVAELKHLQDFCPNRTHMTASYMMWRYEHGELNL